MNASLNLTQSCHKEADSAVFGGGDAGGPAGPQCSWGKNVYVRGVRLVKV